MNPLDQAFIEAFFTVTLGSLVGVLAYIYRWRQYKKQENTLYKLAKLRTSGVELRNEGKKKNLKGADFEKWDSKRERWKEKLINTAKEFSPVEAERLITLDWMDLLDLPTINDKQTYLVSETNETLKRLDRMLEKRFRPTHSP